VRRKPNVQGFVGYWGDGKSLLLARECLQREQEDPRLLVGHNFGFKARNGVELETMDDVITFAAWDTPGWRKLLAIDEIGALAPARGFAGFPPAAEVVFQQGRKLGLSVMWSTQHWKFVDVYVRRVTDVVTECKGMFLKRLTPRGVLPIEHRPRLIRARSFYSPDPDANKLPDRPNRTEWTFFDQEAADSYDTMKLVRNYQMVMQAQYEQAKNSPIVTAITEATEQ